MTASQPPGFAERGTPEEIETGLTFQPKFDDDGLIPAIVSDATSGEVLMFAWMNGDALARTVDTGQAHFWSRSRQKLWRKGEDSGNTLTVKDIRVDCDQDVLCLTCTIEGDGLACHTGAASCFYRRLDLSSTNPKSIRLIKLT